MSEAELAWRQTRLQRLTTIAGMPIAIALGVIEREALWRPWERVVERVPVLKNLDRFR